MKPRKSFEVLALDKRRRISDTSLDYAPPVDLSDNKQIQEKTKRNKIKATIIEKYDENKEEKKE